MSQWTEVKPGYRTKVVTDNGITVRIHRPELAPDKYTKRQKEVLRALANMKGGATA